MGKAKTYHPRNARSTVVHRVVEQCLPELLEQVELGSHSLPLFVQRALEAMLACGDPAFGFTHLRCGRCGADRFLPFSCKTRFICSSCAGRRMNETVAHLMDHVVPNVPVRHWALTFPPPLRYLLAYDAELCSQVINIFVRTVFAWQRKLAKRAFCLGSVRCVHPAAITAIHRVGSALNLNLHLHSVFLDGIFVWRNEGEQPAFRALPAPTKGDILELAWDICLQIQHLLRAAGKSFDVDPAEADQLA